MSNNYLLRDIFGMKYILSLMSTYYPNQIMNKDEAILNAVKPPKHWNLSFSHVQDLNKHFKKQNDYILRNIDCEGMKAFYMKYSFVFEKMQGLIDVDYSAETSSFFKKSDTHSTLRTHYLALSYYYLHIMNMLIEFVVQNKNKSKLLLYVTTLLSMQMNYIDFTRQDYETIKKYTNLSKENEKALKTKYLQEMTDEERNIEKQLKKNKLGKWGVGLQKGLVKYDKETYDREREEFKLIETTDLEMFYDQDVGTHDFNGESSETNFEDDEYEGNYEQLQEEINENYSFKDFPDDDDYENEHMEDALDIDMNCGQFYQNH